MNSNQAFAVVSTCMVNADLDGEEFTPELQRKLREEPKEVGRAFLELVRAGLRMPVNYLIDMDSPSNRVPNDWKVLEEHQLPNRLRGKVIWTPAISRLHWSEQQKTGKMYIGGNELKKELEGLPCQHVTDKLIDWYLDNLEVPTPEEWLGKWIFCWGRIYRNSNGNLIVRCLYCDDDGSRVSAYNYLDDNFHSNNPALVAGK